MGEEKGKRKGEEAGEEDNDGVDIVHEIWGDIGRYPLFINLLISVMNLPIAWQMLSQPFLAPKTNYWCQQPEEAKELWTLEEWRNISQPLGEDGKVDHCRVFNYADLASGKNLTYDDSVECTSFSYDSSFWSETVVSKWDLVCGDSKWAHSYSNAIFMSGVAMGVFATGIISDHWGRHPTMFALVFLKSLTGLAATFMDNFGYWIAVRWVTYFSTMSLMSVKYVLSMEMLSGQHRVTFGMGMLVTYAVGIAIFPFLCHWLRDSVKIQVAMAATNAPFLLFYFIIPESPRWLVGHGRIKEAEVILERGARFMRGKKEMPKIDLEEMLKTNKKHSNTHSMPKPTMLDLFKTSRLRRYTIGMCLIWFAHGFVYYGIGLNVGDIGGDLFVNYFIFGIVDIPGFLLTIVTLTFLKRRVSVSLLMLLSGTCLMSTCFFSKGDFAGDWPIVALAMVAKFCVNITFASIYLFTVELYPTLLRNIGLGTASTTARLGSIVAPMTFALNEYHEKFFPTGLLGLVFLLCSLSILLLPETFKKPLPSTIQEVEEREEGGGGICCRGNNAKDEKVKA